ncbi:reverse transcriptase domain-containing protein [Tanacetum coccineum]
MSVRLADRSFQYHVGIAENMLVEVSKFTFPIDFVILEMEEDSKIPLILGRRFLHTARAVIRVKQKQLILGIGPERMIFNIDSTMKHSYSDDDTCFSIDVIDEILEEGFDALLDEGSQILHSSCREKCHFMVTEGIVVGHNVSGAGLEVDKAKINIILEIPPPTNIKEKRTCAPVIVIPNWKLPYELMCDASDFAVGAILG